MREFGPAVSAELRQRVLDQVGRLLELAPDVQEIPAEEYVLEPADAIVLDRAEILTEDGEIRLSVCRSGWHPPFEWLAEITSYLPGADYLKHYLVRDADIVLAHKRDLTVIDDAEAEVILADLDKAASALADLA